MVIPAAEFIEEAADSLATIDTWAKEDQMKELHGFGDERAIAIGATGLSKDFMIGYELGVQTARVLISMNVAAVEAKVDL